MKIPVIVRADPIYEPHDWFAWFPVKAHDGKNADYYWVWLSTVRRILVCGQFSKWFHYWVEDAAPREVSPSKSNPKA